MEQQGKHASCLDTHDNDHFLCILLVVVGHSFHLDFCLNNQDNSTLYERDWHSFGEEKITYNTF